MQGGLLTARRRSVLLRECAVQRFVMSHERGGKMLRKGQLNRHTRYRPATTTRNTAKNVFSDAAAVKHTTRTLSRPPSTGAAIAMDGGVADTACYYTGR